MKNTKREKKIIRHRRVRAKIIGTAERPRFSVFKSNYHFYAQLINDSEGRTLVAASDKEIKIKKGGTKKSLAFEVGKLIAKKAAEHGIKSAVFDRGGYKFHGIVMELAKGAKEGGLWL